MKAYIAAPFYRKAEARDVQDSLARMGIGSTSRWIDSHLSDYDSKPRVLSQEAQEDLRDIEEADIFVLLTSWPKEGSNGKDVELGYALGRGKRVIIVGEPYNLFHHIPQVQRVMRVEDIRL